MIDTEMESDIARIIVSSDAIERRLNELGRAISSHYRGIGAEEITIICITNGSIIFGADLLRKIDIYARLDCVRVSSYQNEDNPVTEPEIIDQVRLDLTGRHVLLVDDILDTGKTLEKLVMILQTLEPLTLQTCILLEKQGRRQSNYEAQYVGFSIPDEFVVGYGLDFAERYRNLPHIGVLRPELQNPPEWQ